MSSSSSATPVMEELQESLIQKIESKAATADRIVLQQLLTPHLVGKIRIADAIGVGPANSDTFSLSTKVWDSHYQKAEKNGRCRGLFCAAFQGKQKMRRCDVEVQGNYCELCDVIRNKATDDSIKLSEIPEYAIVKKALFAREGIQKCKQFWDEQVEIIMTTRAENNLPQLPGFPYMKIDTLISMLMVRGRVVFKNGGKGGRTYPRSAMIVQAQDEHLQACLWAILVILQHEDKQAFLNRWEAIVKPARLIHEEMIIANKSALMPECGAIQAPDIIREELLRAAEFTEAKGSPAEFVSARTKEAHEWASRRQNERSFGGSPSASSVSSTPPTRVKTKRMSKKQALPMRNVKIKFRVTNPPPIYKQFVVKNSTIPNAGKGLFLTENAMPGEKIARFSGVLISKQEAQRSKSKFLLQISKNPCVIIDAKGSEEWEAKWMNDLERAGLVNNAKFSASNIACKCAKTGRVYINVFATKKIRANVDEVGVPYGEFFPWEDIPQKPMQSTPAENSPSDADEDTDSSFSTPKSQKQTPEKVVTSPSPSGNQVKIYAVAMGRCVGLFHSRVRAEQSTYKFKGGVIKRCATEAEGIHYLQIHGIDDPIRYWQQNADLSSLVMSPNSVVGRKVAFPVGMPQTFYNNNGQGFVIGTAMEADTRVWEIQILGGRLDVITAWPLWWGIQQFQTLNLDSPPALPNASAVDEVEADVSVNFEDAADSPPHEVFFAVRSEVKSAISSQAADVVGLLGLKNAEFKQFASKMQAEKWVDELNTTKWFAFKLADGTGLAVQKQQADVIIAEHPDLYNAGPMDEATAHQFAKHWTMQITKKAKLQAIAKASTLSKQNQIQEMHTFAMEEDISADKAQSNAKEEEKKVSNLQHAKSEVSPEEGIREPDAMQAMAKEKQGSAAVFAVRTFPDTFQNDTPAGSVWLSSASATTANTHGGMMKIFSSGKDICKNIALATQWIRNQVNDTKVSIEDEFEERMQKARKNLEHSTGATSAGTQNNPKSKPGNTKEGENRGGLLSNASVLLDKAQSKVAQQLFPKDAEAVLLKESEVPLMSNMVQIPLPGQAQALTAAGNKHVLTFDNNMQATLTARKFSTFKAFTLAELLEFQQRVEYVASLQPEDQAEVAWSVVTGVRKIVSMASRVYASFRDSGSMGTAGDNFKAYVYLELMNLVMFRVVYTGTMAEMFFMDYAKSFAIKAAGCPGMGQLTCTIVGSKQNGKLNIGDSICLYCGKRGHRADSPAHQAEMAEGGTASKQQLLEAALANIARDSRLQADKKKYWSNRIKSFWETVSQKSDGASEASS